MDIIDRIHTLLDAKAKALSLPHLKNINSRIDAELNAMEVSLGRVEPPKAVPAPEPEEPLAIDRRI